MPFVFSHRVEGMVATQNPVGSPSLPSRVTQDGVLRTAQWVMRQSIIAGTVAVVDEDGPSNSHEVPMRPGMYKRQQTGATEVGMTTEECGSGE